MRLFSFTTGAVLSTSISHADVPAVATDIAPVHSLVSQVMEGVGSPDLIVASGASPHSYALRPSQAKAIQDADLVFWIGADLAPWLERSLQTLSSRALIIELLELPETNLLLTRDSISFVTEDDEHDDATHDHHEHEDGAHDPHAWLSPENAKIWLGKIADVLSEADPENAHAYTANAQKAVAALDVLSSEIRTMLSDVHGRNFIVFHDAYQYFESSFDVVSAGAISLSDASEPSPARISDIQKQVTAQNVTCALGEAQFNPALVRTVLEGTGASSAILDPLGASLTPGPDLYGQMLRAMAVSLADCLAPE